MYTCAVLTISDTAFADKESDVSGPTIITYLNETGQFSSVTNDILPDEPVKIMKAVSELCLSSGDPPNLLLTSGGTGFGRRDSTPEAISPLIEKQAPGLVHLILSTSLNHTPLASLSRPVAGTIGRTLVVTLPGSPKAVRENLDALFSAGVIYHALDLVGGGDSRQLHEKLPASSVGPSKGANEHHRRHHDHHHHHHSQHAKHGGHEHTAPVPKSHDPSLGATSRHRVSPYPLISLAEALKLVRAHCFTLPTAIKKVDAAISNHVLAEDVLVPHHLPSTMTTNVDGYAIHSSLTAGTYEVLTPMSHPLSSEKPIPLKHIYRINTGSPLPLGTNAVVMVEDTTLVRTIQGENGEIEEAEVELLVGAAEGENVRQAGSDARQGDIALEKSTVLRSLGGEIGTIAFVGKTEAKVYRKPVIALLSTGNEVVDMLSSSVVENAGRDGWTGTYDSNRPSLKAALTGMGYEVIDLGIVSDDVPSHVRAMQRGLREADVLLTTGGSSMGSSDLLKPVIERHLGGNIHFGRVSVKPGKPTTFATAPNPDREDADPKVPHKLIFALPGNPASALVMFYIFVVPALRLLGGWKESEAYLPRVKTKIMEDMELDSRPLFHRVHVRATGDGLVSFSTGGQRSSRVASLAGANGLVALPSTNDDPRKSIAEGEFVDTLIIGDIQM